MGLDATDQHDETHEVELNSFFMGKYEVTFDEYDTFCEETQQEKPSPSNKKRGRHPVFNVSWYHALDFCNWLSKKQGLTPVYTIDKEKLDTVEKEKYDDIRWSIRVNWKANGYRLPTEAEWEYAARSRGQISTWAGTNDLDSISHFGNFCDTHCSSFNKIANQDDGFKGLAPTGSFQPNALGIYDMSGNLREWCWDRLGDYPDSLQLNPKGPDHGMYRVYRGGSHQDHPNHLRSISRDYYFPYLRNRYNGFRVCRSAIGKDKRNRRKKRKTAPYLAPKPVETLEFMDISQYLDTMSKKMAQRLTAPPAKLVTTFEGHTQAINAAFFSPDGMKVITNARDSTAKVWDIKGNLLWTLGRHNSSLLDARFSPDGKYIITASFNNKVNLWDSSGQFVANLNPANNLTHFYLFSTTRNEILAVDLYGFIKRWDSKGNLLAEWKGHKGNINDFSYSHDEQLILTCSDDRTAKLWDLNGNLIQEFIQHKDVIYGARFSPDDQHIVTSSGDSTAILWGLDGTLLNTFDNHKGTVYSSTFFPKDSKIITCSWDNTAKIWDFKGKVLRVLDKHYRSVSRAKFSPDAQLFLTTSLDHKPKLWDLEGNLLADLDKHIKGVTSTIFSPDSKLILTSSWDHTAIVWDTKGNIIAKIVDHEAGVSSAVFSPDGKYILTASWDRTARLWALD